MEILVKDPIKTDTSAISKMYIDGVFTCNVLEDTVRAAGVKMFGKTAIPAGRYQIVITKSERFSKIRGKTTFLPLLIAVPGFEGVRIHTGNKPEDTEGCLILGKYSPSTKNWVSSSVIEFSKVFPKMQAALDAGQKIFITITR